MRFVAYAPADERHIQALLQGVSETAQPRPERTEARWALGTQATVTCRGEHLLCNPTSQTLVWEGQRLALDFDVTVAASAPLDAATLIKFDIVVHDVIVARLRIRLELRQQASPEDRQEVETESARTAFASYASPDRERVLDRVASVRTATGLEVWMDCINLRPNDRWQELLGAAIEKRDLFMLFWSEHAADSHWVEWEWRTAFRLKGIDAFQLHPLENLPQELPRELAELHATDPLMDIRRGLRSRTPP